MISLSTLYEQRIASGEIAPDAVQARAIERLSRLAGELARPGASGGLFGLGRKPETPEGVYLWGGVGRGKSMMMDLFFEAAPTSPKRRVHFHDFMLDTHAFIHDWRQKSQDERRKHPAHVRGAGDDPIPPAAKHIADRASLLCFDEFHVTSITDAMILGRLFDQLFDRGVVVVATSNRHPDDLYTDGINRQLFLPFIARLKDKLDIMQIDAEKDYRLERLSAAPVYITPLGPNADTAMDETFQRLTGGARIEPVELHAQGRTLNAANTAHGVARFTFAELCARPLGAADYLAIARNFHTVLIENVPLLSMEKRNEAARFVTLIDALYESKTKLVISAAAEPDDLYPAGDGAFEFERTASRLHEMRSDDYLAAERVDVAESD